MYLDDCLTDEGDEYAKEYLISCRSRVLNTCSKYRERIEELHSANVHLASCFRKSVDSIREFYRTIAYAKMRTGKLVKTAVENGTAAAKLLKTVGKEYKSITVPRDLSPEIL